MQIFTADDGTLYTKAPSSTTLTSRTVPVGCVAQTIKPSFAKYRRASIIAGRYDPMVVYRDDLDTFYSIGIEGPVSAPVLAASGSGTIDGDIIGYVTYVQKSGTTVIHESAPSPPSATISATLAGTVNWSSIIATSPNSRVTHVRLYRSDAGLSARLSAELALGTTSYVDTQDYLELGVQLDLDGGIPPYNAYACTYKARVYYAGDPDNPDYVWFSQKEKPEGVDPLNFFRTTSGEAVTGLGVQGDSLLVFTVNSVDILREFSTDDFAYRNLTTGLGCISHHSIVLINDRLWWADKSGVFLYDGGIRYLTNDNRDFWANEYASSPSVYEEAFAVDDREEHCYILSLPHTNHTYRWVGYYLPFEPSMGGGESQPWWFFDQRTRVDKSLGRLTYGSTRRFRLYVGSSDGYLRQENVATNADDDGDSYLKHMVVNTKLYLMGEPGGDSEEGKNLVRAWSYVESEQNNWLFSVYGGDESAGDQAVGNWNDTVLASALTSGGHSYVAKTVHPHIPEQVSGRGFMFVYAIDSPVAVFWRGLGGYWQLGDAYRGRVD